MPLGEEQADEPAAMSTSIPIHRSAFFVPSILETLSRTKLTDARFPHRQLDDMMAKAYENVDCSSNYDSRPSLSADEKTALTNAVQAIGAQVAAATNASPPATSSSKDVLPQIEQRILLGFCLILAEQYTRAIAELDVARSQLFARLKRELKDARKQAAQRSETDGIVPISSDTSRLQSLQVISLWGLELANRFQGKDHDAMRFRTWRQKAQDEAKSSVVAS